MIGRFAVVVDVGVDVVRIILDVGAEVILGADGADGNYVNIDVAVADGRVGRLVRLARLSVWLLPIPAEHSLLRGTASIVTRRLFDNGEQLEAVRRHAVH